MVRGGPRSFKAVQGRSRCYSTSFKGGLGFVKVVQGRSKPSKRLFNVVQGRFRARQGGPRSFEVVQGRPRAYCGRRRIAGVRAEPIDRSVRPGDKSEAETRSDTPQKKKRKTKACRSDAAHRRRITDTARRLSSVSLDVLQHPHPRGQANRKKNKKETPRLMTERELIPKLLAQTRNDPEISSAGRPWLW